MLNKSKIYWYCQFGGWFFFVLIELITYINVFGYSPGLLINGLANWIAGILLTHIYRLIIIKTNWLNLPLAQLIPRGIIMIILVSIPLTFLNVVLDFYTISSDSTEQFDLGKEFLSKINFAVLPIFFFNLSKYVFLWAIVYHFFVYWEKLLKTETDKFELQAVLKETQYNNLKTQLNPHFLFNSLNGIRTLVDLDPENAKEAITKLSSLLRGSLKMEKNKTVALKEELNTVNDYLAIEKIRFDDRLNIVLDISPETLKSNLPPMMIQTLVENGIKHGISNLKNGGTIFIKSFVKNQNTIIQIINSGQYNLNPATSGLGIENTKERLRILFEEKASFSIKNLDDKNVLTEITLPL
ncbi:MAG: histidine kinase [Bacteroidia bacterium]|nr:histidine kinase [Bacteroidia bacterium]